MSLSSPITDVEFLYCIDALTDWGSWEVEVLTEDGYTLRGRIDGDGTSWDAESFIEDDAI